MWNLIIPALLFDVLHTSQSHNVVRSSPVCSLLATGPSEGTFGQDEKNSTTPFYANVEMDGGSVPMTRTSLYQFTRTLYILYILIHPIVFILQLNHLLHQQLYMWCMLLHQHVLHVS